MGVGGESRWDEAGFRERSMNTTFEGCEGPTEDPPLPVAAEIISRVTLFSQSVPFPRFTHTCPSRPSRFYVTWHRGILKPSLTKLPSPSRFLPFISFLFSFHRSSNGLLFIVSPQYLCCAIPMLFPQRIYRCRPRLRTLIIFPLLHANLLSLSAPSIYHQWLPQHLTPRRIPLLNLKLCLSLYNLSFLESYFLDQTYPSWGIDAYTCTLPDSGICWTKTLRSKSVNNSISFLTGRW